MAKAKVIAKTATVAIKLLWSEGFFQDWRKIPDIDEDLSKQHYHFSQAELGMALLRSKRFLLRRGNRGGYQYIQKYPFTEDGEDEG